MEAVRIAVIGDYQPGSPYRSMDGALRAIRYAREHDRPLLGTCGGFQHLVITGRPTRGVI